MYLAGDYIHPTPHSGRCRVRIYRPDLPEEGSAARDEAVVICTELKDNPGMSVTKAAERIAGEVISFHRLPTPLVWVEHYEDGARGTKEDPHTFDLVTFATYQVEDLGAYMGRERKRIGEPSWKPLDRATVEALIGEALERKTIGPGLSGSGLYTALGRAGSPHRTCADFTLPGCALREISGGETMTTPGGARTPPRALQLTLCSAHRLLSWGRSFKGYRAPAFILSVAALSRLSHHPIWRGLRLLQRRGGMRATHPSPPPSPHQSRNLPASKRALKTLQRTVITLNH